ncbi:MAG: hypothetical protein V4449_02935 [Patescibacteria group bacterium]
MNPEFAIGNVQWVANRGQFRKFGGNQKKKINQSPIGEGGRDRIHDFLDNMFHRNQSRFRPESLSELLARLFSAW